MFDIITHLCYIYNIPNERTDRMEMLHIRLPREQHKELKLCAVTKGQSMTALIGDLIEQYLSKIKREAA